MSPITLHVKEARTFWEKSLGLLSYDKPIPILFRTRFGIHTFGMKYAIDVLVLDSESKVVAVKENLMPNRIYIWNPRYDRVIEMPGGWIQKKGIALGSIVHIQKTR